MRPIPELIIQALSEASRYDLYDRPVVVSCDNTSPEEVTIRLFRPTRSGKPAWTITIEPPLAAAAEAKLTVSGALSLLAPDSSKAVLGRAVIAAAQQLATYGLPLLQTVRHGRKLLQMVVWVGETQDGYWISFGRWPETPGGVSVRVSEDLKQFQVFGGR